jgi:hypothetical protein
LNTFIIMDKSRDYQFLLSGNWNNKLLSVQQNRCFNKIENKSNVSLRKVRKSNAFYKLAFSLRNNFHQMPEELQLDFKWKPLLYFITDNLLLSEMRKWVNVCNKNKCLKNECLKSECFSAFLKTLITEFEYLSKIYKLIAKYFFFKIL